MFLRHLAQAVRNGLGDRAGTFIDPGTQIVEGRTVCLVSCQRSPEPVYLRWKGWRKPTKATSTSGGTGHGAARRGGYRAVCRHRIPLPMSAEPQHVVTKGSDQRGQGARPRCFLSILAVGSKTT